MRFILAVLTLIATTASVHALPEQILLGVNKPSGFGQTWSTLAEKVLTKIWKPADKHVERPQNAHRPKDTNLSKHMLAQYGGDVVLRFNVSTAHEVESLREAIDTLVVDVWEFTNAWVDIRLAEDLVPSLLALLPTSLHHAHVPLFQDNSLAWAVYDTFPRPQDDKTEAASSPLPHRKFSPSLTPSASSTDSNIFFSDYQPLSVIVPWMRLLSSLFTTHTRLIQIGTTFEGRDIHAFKIGVHPTNRQEDAPKRKSILLAAGLHAREWISTSTANYIAYSLITGYGKSAPITDLLEAFDFIIVPTVNPDGYVYTWETDRLWRKNRQQTPLRFCQGLDLDHSFGFAWDGDATAGNACSESYAGERPFQATEARQLADWAKNETDKNNVEFVSFIDLHSYSQQILYPYGYSCDAEPPGLEDLEELAYGLEKAIRVSHGHEYEVMPACEGNSVLSKESKKILPALESPGGSALDYFHHELHARWSYQIKLRDRGTYGFLLPREHIVPSGKEIFEAMLYLGSFLTETYGLSESKPSRARSGSLATKSDEPEDLVGQSLQDNEEVNESSPPADVASDSESNTLEANDADVKSSLPSFTKQRDHSAWELRRARR